MLTAKQEKFCQNIISGMTQADAYRNSYNVSKMTDKSVWERASALMKDSKVASRIADLRSKLESETIMTAKQRLEWLSEVIKSGNEVMTDRLKACDIMNKMQGDYVQKIEAEVTKEVNIVVELVDE